MRSPPTSPASVAPLWPFPTGSDSTNVVEDDGYQSRCVPPSVGRRNPLESSASWMELLRSCGSAMVSEHHFTQQRSSGYSVEPLRQRIITTVRAPSRDRPVEQRGTGAGRTRRRRCERTESAQEATWHPAPGRAGAPWHG